MLQRIKDGIKVIIGRANAVTPVKPLKTPYYCPVCETEDIHFEPLPFFYLKELDKNQYIHSLFQGETMNLEFYTCSNCGASDRDRLYALYFNKIAVNKSLKILDIAPAPAFEKFLRRQPNFKVRTADLFMKGVDDIVDITNMIVYDNESFDVFICSHVLEHIEDDLVAMRELYRILAKGGWGIAMAPINLALKENYEDCSIKDEAGRWKHFGQNDHVRMYSKQGFVGRLQSVGFNIQQLDVSYFGADVFNRNGIHPRSVLYIVSK